MKSVGIGIAGFGTVGQGVWKHLSVRSEQLSRAAGISIRPVVAAARDIRKKRPVEISASQLVSDAMKVVHDPKVDIVCELIGGIEFPKEVTLAALRAGKTVVTANKALLCEHGEELFAEARASRTGIFFEASVAGGIPIIKALREGMVANRFPSISGILNGTCNYILTRMERERKPFSEIVEDARRLGYVEADESLDLDGWDAAHKTVLLAALAHGKWIPLSGVPVNGIRKVTLEDIEWAEKLGYRIKLLSLVTRKGGNGPLFAAVQPALLPREAVLAKVDGVFNAVSVEGDIVGESILIGRGAGQDPTANAVISDIVDAVAGIRAGRREFFLPDGASVPLADLAHVRHSFYVRMKVADQPGVLAILSSILAEHSISIENLLQRPEGGGGSAHLILTTHEASEAEMQAAVRRISGLSKVLEPPLLLRIADTGRELG